MSIHSMTDDEFRAAETPTEVVCKACGCSCLLDEWCLCEPGLKCGSCEDSCKGRELDDEA